MLSPRVTPLVPHAPADGEYRDQRATCGFATMTPTGRASSVEDWRRLVEILLRQEKQFELQLRQAAEGQASVDELHVQLRQLRALRSLCEGRLEQARGQLQKARVPTSAIRRPGSGTEGARNLQSSPARLHARRADHTILVVDDHPPTLYAATRLL